MTDAATTVQEPARAPGRGRGRPRGSYAKSEETRSAILDAALEVFAQGGFRGGALRAVAERVGMSEAGLLHHFKSKSALLIAVLERRDELTYNRVPLDQLDGVAALRRLVALVAYNATKPGVVELFCTLSAEATSPDHPAHAYFQNRYEWTRNSLAVAFGKVEAGGGLRPGVSPEIAARSTIAMMDGLQVQWLMDRDSLNMAEELRRYFRQISTLDL